MMERLETVKQRCEGWWEGKNTEPVIYALFPDGFQDYSPVAKPWMAPVITRGWSNWQQEFIFGQAVELVFKTGQWQYVDEALDLLEFYADRTGHAAEGFPFLLPTLGAAFLPAFVTNCTRFHNGTIWLGLDQPWEWEQIEQITADTRAPYWDITLEATRRLVQRLQSKYVIAMPDMGAGLDVLSPIRDTQTLLMDLLDVPEKIHQALDNLGQIWSKAYAEFAAIIQPGNHGCSVECMRWLSVKPTHISYCDFSAMISPDLFCEFVLPMVEHEARLFPGRLAFHLDGPGELPHLEHLLTVPGLAAIQWVPGAGNYPCCDPHHDAVYRQILEGGKKICIGAGLHELDNLQRLFRLFPKQAFYVGMTFHTRQQAEDTLRKLGR